MHEYTNDCCTNPQATTENLSTKQALERLNQSSLDYEKLIELIQTRLSPVLTAHPQCAPKGEDERYPSELCKTLNGIADRLETCYHTMCGHIETVDL